MLPIICDSSLLIHYHVSLGANPESYLLLSQKDGLERGRLRIPHYGE